MVLQKPDIQGQKAEKSFQNYQQKSAAVTLDWLGKIHRTKDTLQGRGLGHCLFSRTGPASCIAVTVKPSTAQSSL